MPVPVGAIAEVDENSLQHTSYLYEPYTFKPLAMLQGTGHETEVYYYQLDHLGTPQELTNTQGKIVWSAQYRAYGQLAIAEVEEVTNPLRFQGQYHDLETGLYYNRHRYYDPNSGRFTTIDPIALAGGLNNYQYVPNPTGWVDPLGLACKPGDCPAGLSESEIKEIQGIPKGDRPLPNQYLSSEYINNHLELFDGGASRFMTSSNVEKYGIGQSDGTSFVMPKHEADALLARTNGNQAEMEKALGLPSNFLDGHELVRVDIPDPKSSNLRIPSGNEAGANEQWIPGGKLPGGSSEAVIDVKLLDESGYKLVPLSFKRQ